MVLGQIGDARAIAPLLTLGRSERDLFVRSTTGEALRALGWVPGGTPAEAASDLVAPADWEGLAPLGEPAVEAIVARLDTVDLINSPECLTADTAALALARIGKSAIPSLRWALVPSSDDSFSYGNTAYFAAKGLAQMEDEAATTLLLTRLGDAEFARRCDVARALAFSPEPRATSALLEHLGDKDPALRAAAIEGLSTRTPRVDGRLSLG